MFTSSFHPLLPVLLTILIASGLVIALGHGVLTMLRRGVGRGWVSLLTLLRVAAAAVFMLILLQPVVSFTRRETSPPQVMVLVDVSPSMAGRDAGTGELENSKLRAALDERYALDWYAFDGTARHVQDLPHAPSAAGGKTTRLDESLTAAWSHAAARGVRPARVVLVSDGHDHSAIDPAEIARQYQLKVDVLPAAAPTNSRHDLQLTIADVQGAHRVLLGSDTHLRVRIMRSQLSDGEQAKLVVREEGRELLRRDLKFASGQHEAIVEVTHRPATAGSKQYELELVGDSTAAKSKNQQAIAPYKHHVHVVDTKQEVLVLEDTWRWEYRYLHRLLEDDPSFRFTAFLARGKGTYLQLGSPDRQVSLIGLPQDAGDLAGFDLLVLGDIDPQQMSDELVAALRSAVADEGKSLVVIAGPRLGRLTASPELHALLPVELSPQSGEPIDGPIAVRWPAEARESPLFFQFELPAEELPPLDQVYPVVRRRAGATILLEAAGERNAYGPQIVMAEHALGHGRVLFIGTDTLWKWQTLAPDGPGLTPYALFWQQALRALAPARTSRGEAQLWLTADRTRAAVGRRLTLRLEATSARPLADARVEGTISTPTGDRLPLVFSPDGAPPKFWQTTIAPQSVGTHRLVASLVDGQGEPLAVSQQVIEIESSASESADAGVDLAALARLASATGGKMIDPTDPATWPSEVGPPPRVETSRSHALWENYSLLIALCAILGIDWLIRAVRGLT